MTQHWLVKTEPGEYSFDKLLQEGETVWDGVRNYQACRNLGQMQLDDWVLVYHSIGPKSVVGIAWVSRTAYPDPTDNPDGRWQVVRVKPHKPLQQPVSLATIKADPVLQETPLVKQSRLSVMPLTSEVFHRFLSLSQTAL